MQNGIEQLLRKKFPTISQIIQDTTKTTAISGSPKFNKINLDKLLNGIRPLLAVAGGKLVVKSFSEGVLQPSVTLSLKNMAIVPISIQQEITSRICDHFKLSVIVNWVD